MSDSNGNGNGKQTSWLMGIVGTLLTAGAIGWASAQADQAQKTEDLAQAVKAEVAAVRADVNADRALMVYRLSAMENELREQRKMLEKIWNRSQGGER
jgi:hypothetical protein